MPFNTLWLAPGDGISGPCISRNYSILHSCMPQQA